MNNTHRIAVHWIDVTANLQLGIQPVMLLERKLLHGDSNHGNLFSKAEVTRTGHYWVPQGGLVGDTTPPVWSLTREGQHVRVPIVAYRTAHRAASSILATGLEIGMSAVLNLRQYTPELPLISHIVLGHECTDLSPHDAYRCYVGIAIQTKL